MLLTLLALVTLVTLATFLALVAPVPPIARGALARSLSPWPSWRLPQGRLAAKARLAAVAFEDATSSRTSAIRRRRPRRRAHALPRRAPCSRGRGVLRPHKPMRARMRR